VGRLEATGPSRSEEEPIDRELLALGSELWKRMNLKTRIAFIQLPCVQVVLRRLAGR
jgi:hypothetical protein